MKSTNDQDQVEELYEEKSALEQAQVSEETEEEGTFLTGGNKRDTSTLEDEKELDEDLILNPKSVKDGEALLQFLRSTLHRFDAPYAYIGGEMNSPKRDHWHQAEVRILQTRLSTYEAVGVSMSHSMMKQIYEELPKVFVDLTFLPKPTDYALLRDNGFPVWFGTNTKMAPHRFDVISISHAVCMEQLNFISLLHDSGIPIFKQQRMDDEDIPLIVVGGANSGTIAPLCGPVQLKGKEWSCFIDCLIYGDGEQAAQTFIEIVREGKKKGWTKKQILRECHGKVEGFYEPDKYEHVYDGKSSILEIKKKEEYVQFPVPRATVINLDEVRTLESKVIHYTGDGSSVDVAIAGSVGCIGSGGWGACSFCREGSEGPYRERSLGRVMEALAAATRNQGTKEVSFFSLNFNQYNDFFPLVAESVKQGYKVGLISQRVDMLAETPEQIRVQRWLKKSNYTLGVEGISGRMRSYLNKNLQEWELLKVCTEMMLNGARELKFFYIITGIENDADKQEMCTFMERVNAIKEKLIAPTRFRISFTPLFPAAFTALQYAPVFAASKHGSRSMDPIFNKARELGWGRRMSVSGEEPMVSNSLTHGGRNITRLLLQSHFSDGFRFYGSVPKGTWARWKKRIDADPNIDVDVMWGEKNMDYIFPWEDIDYSTSKEILWRAYIKAVAYQGISYCLTTRTVKGVCHVNECGACDPKKTGTPEPLLIKLIVGRKTAPVIPTEEMEKLARAREKAYHVRVLFETNDPIFRFVLKGYYKYAIASALMKSSEDFYDAFVGGIGHARMGAGSNQMIDWTYGKNIYDFSLCRYMSEPDLKALIEPANKLLGEAGKIIDIRMDHHMMVLRNDVDFAVYTILVPNEILNYKLLSSGVSKYYERLSIGKDTKIKIRVAKGKDIFRMEERTLSGEDVLKLEYKWVPELRGTLMRAIVSATYNPIAMLEGITGRKKAYWKKVSMYCDGYIQLDDNTQETDVFAALAGEQSHCKTCNGPLEIDLFSGKKNESGVCIMCDTDQYEVDFTKLQEHTMWAVNAEAVAV